MTAPVVGYVVDPALPRGKFKTIVADPPWRYDDQGGRFTPSSTLRTTGRTLYPTMTLEQVCALPVPQLAARYGAHLYLWIPNALLLSHGPPVLAAWGFTYKTCLAWGKLTKNGKLAFGGGHYYRGAHELCLLAVRRNRDGTWPTGRVRNERSLILAPGERAGVHSSKPAALQDRIERVSPGPYLELFARRTRPGWTVWGNQIAAGGTP